MSLLVSHAKELGLLEAFAYHQTHCLVATITFVRSEGIIPAPEQSRTVKGALEEAMHYKRESKAQTILFNLSGHGHFDMNASSESLKIKIMMSKSWLKQNQGLLTLLNLNLSMMQFRDNTK